MSEIKVRNLDPRVAAAVKQRAKARGVSAEAEIRRTLGESVALKREGLARRATASRAATRPPRGRMASDSADLIREDRDAWG